MITSFHNLRVVLIGGSSHAGKSTLAQSLASQLGWSCRSTDKLAKHPGRPWRTPPKTVPEHVAAHYLTLSVGELTADVLRHYRDNVWPLVEALIAAHASDPSGERLVIEGSAILPEMAAAVTSPSVAAMWLTAGQDLFTSRIRGNSGYETRSPDERLLIDKFLGRTVRYNERMMEVVERLGLARLDVGKFSTGDELLQACLSALAPQPLKTADAPTARVQHSFTSG